MTKIYLVTLALLSLGCAQSVDLRASHFAVPITSDENWNGKLYLSSTSNTKVTVLSDYTSNPPVEGDIRINEDFDVGDLFFPIETLGLDASLHSMHGLEILVQGSKAGLRWQFLGHGAQDQAWVAALHGLAGGFTQIKSRDPETPTFAEARSEVATTQAGISLGYRTGSFVPYVSFIKENHNIKTSVTNSGGAFGPYKDSGEHLYYSVGLTTPREGLSYTVEASGIAIAWEGKKAWQNSLGLRLGYAW